MHPWNPKLEQDGMQFLAPYLLWWSGWVGLVCWNRGYRITSASSFGRLKGIHYLNTSGCTPLTRPNLQQERKRPPTNSMQPSKWWKNGASSESVANNHISNPASFGVVALSGPCTTWKGPFPSSNQIRLNFFKISRNLNESNFKWRFSSFFAAHHKPDWKTFLRSPYLQRRGVHIIQFCNIQLIPQRLTSTRLSCLCN